MNFVANIPCCDSDSFRLIHNEDVLPGGDTDANYAECKTIKTINTGFCLAALSAVLALL